MQEIPSEFGRLSIARLRCKAGDTLVVKSDRKLPAETASRIAAHCKHLVPDGVQVMVLEQGFELSVLEKRPHAHSQTADCRVSAP